MALIEDPWLIAGFYAVVILLVFYFRNKFEFQGKIIALLRTNTGVEWMQRTGEKYSGFFRVMGYIGIYVGYLGMLFIVAMLGYGLWSIFFRPEADPVLTPLIPGVQIPGSPIGFPLIETLIALFFVIVIHEASHGLVAAAHGLKVESSGLLVLGPIFGAFVEPNEKALQKKSHRVQKSVFAAGPWSNILGFFLFFGLLIGFTAIATPWTGPSGVFSAGTTPDSPAEAAGIPAGITIIGSDLGDIGTIADLTRHIEQKSIGDEMTLYTQNDTAYKVTLGEATNERSPFLAFFFGPAEPEPWIGFPRLYNTFSLATTNPFLFGVIVFIEDVLFWTFVIMLGLGIANLLPLGPVDGGRMWQLTLREWFGKERGDAYWSKTAVILLLIVAIVLVVPIVRAVIPTISSWLSMLG